MQSPFFYHQLRASAKRLLRPYFRRPVLGPLPYGGPADSSLTFAAVCGVGFDFRIPNANSTYRLGLCRGFEQIGVRFQLVSVFEVAQVLPQLNRPMVLLSVFDYENLSSKARKVLRRYPHFVWLTPGFPDLEKVYAEHSLPDPRVEQRVARRVLESGAAFGFGPVPPSCVGFFDDWQSGGLPVKSLPQACDTTRYFPEPGNQRYAGVELGFVGGYWAYKNVQFEKYLKPYESRLTVFGYNKWPYSGYRGLLPEGDERVLYQNARVCPALSEPHAEVMGDIVERAFKIMGSGGLTVPDAVPFYRELFSSDELLVPANVSEYHEMIQQALSDPSFNQGYRDRGYRAILERHTYAHRARQILNLLGLHPPEAKRSE